MVDYRITIKKIHSAIPELTTDELITIMDCITDIVSLKDTKLIQDPYRNKSTWGGSILGTNDIIDYNTYALNSPITTNELKVNTVSNTTKITGK